MSRCFPYPPPSYERRRASGGEALIKSIEIQRKSEADSGKRKEKRERKEKRHHHKKNKDRITDDFSWNSKKLDEVPIQNEIESERSALTEEHGQPVLVDSLSDGSDSSSKRKRASSSSNLLERGGKKLRISFTLKKQPVLDLSIDEQQVCSTSGREAEHHVQPRNVSNLTQVDLWEASCSTKEKLPVALLSDGKTKSVSSQYKILIEDWVPPPQLQVYDGSDDELEWLFSRKDQTGKRKALESQDGVSFNGATNIYPRACYLPEADIHALPYVTPF